MPEYNTLDRCLVEIGVPGYKRLYPTPAQEGLR